MGTPKQDKQLCDTRKHSDCIARCPGIDKPCGEPLTHNAQVLCRTCRALVNYRDTTKRNKKLKKLTQRKFDFHGGYPDYLIAYLREYK